MMKYAGGSNKRFNIFRKKVVMTSDNQSIFQQSVDMVLLHSYAAAFGCNPGQIFAGVTAWAVRGGVNLYMVAGAGCEALIIGVWETRNAVSGDADKKA